VIDRWYLLVANPTAQSGRARAWIDEALAEMKARDMRVELVTTEPERRTIDKVRVRLEAGGVDCVVYLGGDGTFHEVATGILEAGKATGSLVPMGMLPSGTANDQGLSFGIRRGEIARNVGVISEGHITQLDVGWVEQLDHEGQVLASSYFFDSCGWGTHSDILATRNRQKRKVASIPIVREIYRDKMVYFSASFGKLFESYFSPLKFRAEVTADGERHVLDGLLDLIISATPIYAGHWVLDRQAEPDDGLFELVPMQGRRDWASKALRDLAASPIWQEQLDAIGLTHSQGFRAAKFDIDLLRPADGEILAQVDGEEWRKGDRFRVTVLPRRLPIITPADFVPPWRPKAERSE
jgi:diacylglycerol kinase family enzyme